MNVSLGAVFANLGVLGVLTATKLGPKFGLVFRTISALYGLTAHIINRTQFSLLVTVVVLSAIIPTAIAQRRFGPIVETERLGDRRPVGVTPAPPAPASAPSEATSV